MSEVLPEDAPDERPTDEELRDIVAPWLRGPSAPTEGMPGWYWMLTDLAQDPGAPEDVRMNAEFAVQYVNDLRAAHRELQQGYERARLRYVDARSTDHDESSDALGVERGSLSWSELLERVRDRRSAGR